MVLIKVNASDLNPLSILVEFLISTITIIIKYIYNILFLPFAILISFLIVYYLNSILIISSIYLYI